MLRPGFEPKREQTRISARFYIPVNLLDWIPKNGKMLTKISNLPGESVEAPPVNYSLSLFVI